MTKHPDVSLVLPCYNEESHFEKSVAEIVRMLGLSRLVFEIIFVDDGSTDKTISLIEKTVKKFAFCRKIIHRKNLGRGIAVADGIRQAKAEIVGYIDIDLEVSPMYIADMVDILRRGHDVVIGKRMYRSNFSSILREILSSGYRGISRYLLDTGGLDTETGYKFFRTSRILRVLPMVRHPHWFWDTEVMVYAKRSGLKIAEVPVLFVRRTDKKSTVRIFRDTIEYISSLIQLRWRLRDESMK
ncbi:MAG: glycosyltransferase [bacterium]|nr:glycosyltransferase [bacterium]